MAMDAELLMRVSCSMRIMLFAFLGQLIMLRLNTLMMYPRRRLYGFAAYMFFKMVFTSIIMRVFILPDYGGAAWADSLQMISNLFFQVLACYMIYLHFQGSFAKNLVTAVLAEIVCDLVVFTGVIFLNVLEGHDSLMEWGYPFQVWELLYAGAVWMVFLGFVHLVKPLLLRYRELKLRHERVMLTVALGYVTLAAISNIVQGYPYESNISSKIGLGSGMIALISLFLTIWRNMEQTMQEQKFLLDQRRLMGHHYHVLQDQILQVQYHLEQIDRQMDQIEHMVWNGGVKRRYSLI